MVAAESAAEMTMAKKIEYLSVDSFPRFPMYPSAIIVFGSSRLEVPQWVTYLVNSHAKDLASLPIIISGKGDDKISQAEIFERELKISGIDNEIILENKATNLQDQAKNISNILVNRGISLQKLIVVDFPLNMRASLLALNEVGITDIYVHSSQIHFIYGPLSRSMVDDYFSKVQGRSVIVNGGAR